MTTIKLESLYCVTPPAAVARWGGIGLAIRVDPDQYRSLFWQPDGVTQLVYLAGCDVQFMSASAALCKRYLAAYAWRGWHVVVTYWLSAPFRQYPQGRVKLHVPYSLVVYLGAVEQACKQYMAVAELPSRAVIAGWTTGYLLGADGAIRRVADAQHKLPIALNIRRRKYYTGRIVHPSNT